MNFEYAIKGITLNESEMRDIKECYEAICTAEYLMDNYSDLTEEEALTLGYEVRKWMDKYDTDETDAVYEVMKNRKAVS